MKEIKHLDRNAVLRGWGGDKMETNGVEIVKHYKDLAFMGFVEVIKNLSTIFKNLSFSKEDILQFRPDVLILIDYPGFNLRIAKWAHQKGIKVVYYISPQIWAWKESRVKGIKKYVDKMLVILPFEQAFYKKWDYEAIYVGHPLVQVIEDFKKDSNLNKLVEFGEHEKIIALLPGSRKQELEVKLPIMLKVAEHFTEFTFVIAKAPGISNEFYDGFISAYANVKTVSDKTYQLLGRATAALVTSGTATLETALFNVPQVVCYKGNKLSYEIAKRIITIKYISLVNLIMDKEVVTELIQDDLTVNNLVVELKRILFDAENIKRIKQSYHELHSILSEGGDASKRAADIIYNNFSN